MVETHCQPEARQSRANKKIADAFGHARLIAHERRIRGDACKQRGRSTLTRIRRIDTEQSDLPVLCEAMRQIGKRCREPEAAAKDYFVLASM
ncbi:hypothetical protein [Caballeronia sp. Sq4a]|uniref:hypothetical protein n=1 Tax=Caballeronia sp. Sq4a TaxID=2878152 RepID=UPI0020BE9A8E|nr:hypothetical protein [Caballeronia sp. Sq4a]